MPQYLRHDTIRMFEASCEYLDLAVGSLAKKKRIEFKEPEAEYAAEIGLIGASAELAMSACLVQAFGSNVLKRESGKYQTYTDVLNKFRKLVKEATVNSNFITQGVHKPNDHREKLLKKITQFRVLGSTRAGGLHAGKGLSLDVTVFIANEVNEFLTLLSESTKVSPYLSFIPRCPTFEKENRIIIEDLSRRIKDHPGKIDGGLLSSIFLVLPDLSDDEPEWLSALERVNVSPREKDINYLLETLANANTVTLYRSSQSGKSIPVTINADDPDAITIAPHFLKSQFTSKRDQLRADIGTANGRLEEGFVDLPPVEAIRTLFAIGIDDADIIGKDEFLTPHQAWPLVAASLKIQGTPGPYWFIIKRTKDLPNLKSYINRVIALHSSYIIDHRFEILNGIGAMINNTSISQHLDVYKNLFESIDQSDETRQSLFYYYEKNKNTARKLPSDFERDIVGICELGHSVNPLLEKILNSDLDIAVKRYWSTTLASIASDLADLPGMQLLLNDDNYYACSTAAKKAMRRIDFTNYGPPFE